MKSIFPLNGAIWRTRIQHLTGTWPTFCLAVKIVVIGRMYYIHGPWRDRRNFCCFMCGNYGPYTRCYKTTVFLHYFISYIARCLRNVSMGQWVMVKWVNKSGWSRGSWVSTCDQLTHNTLTDDKVSQSSRTIWITFAIRHQQLHSSNSNNTTKANNTRPIDLKPWFHVKIQLF